MTSLTLARAFTLSAIIGAFSAPNVGAQGLGGATGADSNEAASKTAPASEGVPKSVPKDVPTPEPTPSKAPEATTKVEPQAEKIDKSRLPPLALYQTMLKANKKKGWVQFRNFNGKQLVYFTMLQTLHCRLKEIRYSINHSDLDKRFNVVKCNPYVPFALPSDVKTSDMYMSFAPKSVSSVTVQVVWEDGGESENITYTPCPDVGELSCAVMVE